MKCDIEINKAPGRNWKQIMKAGEIRQGEHRWTTDNSISEPNSLVKKHMEKAYVFYSTFLYKKLFGIQRYND